MKVKTQHLVTVLDGYNPYTMKYLINRFTFGFQIGYVCLPDCREPPKNHPPVTQHLDTARELVQKEVQLGQVLGPFKTELMKELHCSPLNLVPKAGNPGEFRFIHNLAYPYDHNSVNANIPDCSSVCPL